MILFFSFEFILLIKQSPFVHKSLSCDLNPTSNVLLTILIFRYQMSQISELFYLLQQLSICTNFHFCLSDKLVINYGYGSWVG